MTVNVNLETKNVIKIFALATGFTISVFALIRMYDAIMMVLIAFFIALALNPAVKFLSKGMPGKRRGPAVAIVVVGVFALLTFLLASIIPPLASETGRFAKTLPDTLNNTFYNNEKVQNFIDRYGLQDDIDSATDSIKQRTARYGDEALTRAGEVGASIITTLSVLVMAVLMLTGGPKFLKQVADKVYQDGELRARHEELGAKMYQSVTGYVVGQVSVATVASLFALGALILLGIPYPLPLAGIVFVFGLIPLIGNTFAAILVVLAALVLKDVPSALILGAYFILYQQIENVTLQPLVQGKTTQLPTLVIFISVILGVGLIGPIGGLFAIPAAGCAKVLLNDYLTHRKKRTDEAPKTLVEKVKHKVAKAASA